MSRCDLIIHQARLTGTAPRVRARVRSDRSGVTIPARVLHRGPQSLGSSVAVIEVEPGAPHAEAWSRRSDKYYPVSSGEIRFVLDGKAHTMKVGDFCFVKKGRRFSYSNEGSQLAILTFVHTPRFDPREEVFADQQVVASQPANKPDAADAET